MNHGKMTVFQAGFSTKMSNATYAKPDIYRWSAPGYVTLQFKKYRLFIRLACRYGDRR